MPQSSTTSTDPRKRCLLECLTVWQELHALNSYFIGEEESMVIRIQALASAINAAQVEDKAKYSGSVVQFHGDLVALFHWVILNYAAVTKILKKCDKLLEGQPIRQTYLMTVALRQPFYSTEQIEKLAKQCEQMIIDVNLSPEASRRLERSPSITLFSENLHTEKEGKEPCLNRMLYAIQTWRDLGDNAHTPSTVLPYSKPLPDSMKMLEKCKEHSSAIKKRAHLEKRTHLDENAEVPPIKIARVSDS